VVDAVGVRPVGLDRDGREALLFNESFSDLRALAVELVRAVLSLAEQDESRIADQPDQRVIICDRARQRVRGFANGVAQVKIGWVSH